MTGGLALLLVLLAAAAFRSGRTEPVIEDGEGADIGHHDAPFTHVPTGDPDDPSQLVLPDLIAADAVGPTVRRGGVSLTPLDEDVLRDILEAIQLVPQEELRRRVDHSIEWKDFADPDRRNGIMGRVCRFRGTLRRLEETSGMVDFPEMNIDRLYEGQIQDATHNMYSFYIIEKPDRPLGRADVAEITGVFYKLITYTSRDGEDRTTPLIVARTLEAQKGGYGRRGLHESFAGFAPGWLFYPFLLGVPALSCLVIHLILKRKPRQKFYGGSGR